MALHWACEHAAEILATRSKSRVRAAPAASGGAPQARDQVFGLELANGALVTLDLAAARALANAQAAALGGMRGTGELSGSEHGLLEALALEVAHELSSSEAAAPALASVLRGPEVARRLQGWPGFAVDLAIEAGGRAGAGSVWLPVRPAPAVLAFPPEGPDAAAGVRVTLALPVLRLQASEHEGLVAGDVVLLGATRLGGLSGCELVTTGGWRLSAARLARDTAGMVTVARGPLALGDPELPEARPGVVPARMTMGEAWLDASELENWAEGAVLDLVKEADRPALLHVAGAAARPVELVAVEGEIGARVLA